MRRKIFLILAILWASVIFYLSHQPASVSSGQSGGVINMLSNLPLIGGFIDYMMEIDIAEFVIRKSAHMFAFGLLAVLIFMSMYESNNDKVLYIRSLFFTFLYACSDEFHQLFIEGRSGEVRDVLVDSFGASILLLILYIVINKLDAKKLKENN